MGANIKELIVKPRLFGSPSLYILQAFRPIRPFSSINLSDFGGELSIDFGSPSQRINNISEDYWMVEFPGESRENTRRISAGDTASLGEKFSLLDEVLVT